MIASTDLMQRVDATLCRPLLVVLRGDLEGGDVTEVEGALGHLATHLKVRGFTDDEIVDLIEDAAGEYQSGKEQGAAPLAEAALERLERFAASGGLDVPLPPCAAAGCHFHDGPCQDPGKRHVPFNVLASPLERLAEAEPDARSDLLRALVVAAPFLDRLDQGRLVAELKKHRPKGLKASDIEEAVQDAVKVQREREAEAASNDGDEGDELGVHEVDGAYVRVSETKLGRVVTKLSTFVHRPERIVETAEGGELVEGLVIAEDGSKYDDLTLGPSDFTSASSFRAKHSRHGKLAFFGNDQAAQAIMQRVHTTQGVPRVPGTTVLGLHLRDGRWCHVDSNGSLTADGSSDDAFVFATAWDPPVTTAILRQTKPTPEQLRELAEYLFRFNTQMITAVINGWDAASLMKPRFQMLLGEGFPHLANTGPKGSGKTQTEEKVVRRTLSITKGATSARKATDFTLLHGSSGSNNIPLIIEEFKPSKMPVRAVQAIESLLRDAYDGHEAGRGQRNLSVRTYRQQAPIVLVGEERPTEPAILERTLLLVFSKETSRPHKKDFDHLVQLQLGGLGRLVLEHGLRTSDDQWREVLRDEDLAVHPDLSDRVRANCVQVRAGIRLLEATFRANGVEVDFSGLRPLVDQAIIEHVLDGRKEARTVVSTIIEAWATEVEVARRNAEAAKRTDAPRPRSSGFDVVYGIVDKDGRLEIGVSVKQTFPGFKEWSKRTGFDGEVPDRESFLSALRQEKYYRGTRSVRVGDDDIVTKCHILDLQVMLDEGLDVGGFRGGTNGQAETATVPVAAPTVPDHLDLVGDGAGADGRQDDNPNLGA